MESKEKARELVHSFLKASFGAIEEYVPVPHVFAKQCALIAVDEILRTRPSLPVEAFGGSINLGECCKLSKAYWQEVRKEIEKL